MKIRLHSSFNKEAPKRTFNLRRYFSFFSIGIIFFLTVILSAVVYWNQKEVLIQYSISDATSFAQKMTDQIYSEFIASNVNEYGYLHINIDSQHYDKLNNIAESYLKNYSDIEKIKIYNLSGTTVYSTDKKNIGIVNTSEKLKAAFMGKVGSVLTKRVTPIQEDSTEKGKKYQIDLMEIYVPIYNSNESSKNEIIGAVEIYKDVSSLFRLMRQEFHKIPLLLIFSTSVFYIFFQIVIRKANNIINKQNEDIDLYNAELEEAQERIKKAIDEVIENESFHVRLQSDNLLKCWEAKNCVQVGCPGYKSENLRCWQVAGTFCGGKVQGYFAKKYGDCRQCNVYQNAFKDRINLIGESFNNMMVLLESKHMQLQKLNEKLHILIDTDHLTAVSNRRSFQKRIESIHLISLRYNHPYSIIICDVDNFKTYNDTYGHQKGDYALVSIANIMKTSIRRTDEIFRWGGEEFIIILPEQNLSSAIKVAENLRLTVEALAISHAGSQSKILSISLGVACNIAENIKYISWESVIKQADDELYKAKSAGKNCVFPSINIKNVSDEKI